MTREEFIVFLETAMSLDEGILSESTYLQGSGFMDSLAMILITAEIDERFNKDVAIDELRDAKTVGDLLDYIGNEHFEG